MSEFKKGLHDGVPIALGYLSVSFTFGLQGTAGGLTWWETLLISVCNLTSAGQFAGLGIMLGGSGAWIEMACSQLIINMRYSLMSLSLSQKVSKSLRGIHRWLAGYGITDEIYVVAAERCTEVTEQYMYGLILLPFFGWSLGTFLGAVAGEILPAIIRNSLGIAIYGMFLAIIIPPAKKNSAVLKVVVISAVLSCLFKWVPVMNKVSGGFVIIICTLISAAVGAFFFPVRNKEAEK